jgi:fucose 4-O-acetylase-like acetyltransferase
MGVPNVRSQRVNVIPADLVLPHYPFIVPVGLVLSGYLSETVQTRERASRFCKMNCIRLHSMNSVKIRMWD